LKYEGDLYPCKLLISWAHIFANRKEFDPNPSNFQTNMAIAILKNLEFQIIQVGQDDSQKQG